MNKKRVLFVCVHNPTRSQIPDEASDISKSRFNCSGASHSVRTHTDVMIRGDYAWLHVNDGTIAIGIWAPKTMIQDIHFAGDYHKKGDIVEISGVFHRSCPEHGGDLDIHASEIKKITLGNSVVQPISRKKAYFGVYSLILVLLFYALKKFF